MSLMLAMTAGARVASASASRAHATARASSQPLSVRDVAVDMVRDRIFVSATIVNTQNAPVRPTTGALGLISGSGSSATGVRTFSVPALPARSSRRVRFSSGRLVGLPVAPGIVKVVLCADVNSQIRRFSPNSNCARVGALAIPPEAVRTASGPEPNTILRDRPTAVTGRSTAVFAFASTVAGSTFQCSLDGGPRLTCRSPQRYTELVDGRHTFAVRAIGPSGRPDATPARTAWTVDTVAPKVTLRGPANGSTTSDHSPVFSGTGGTAATDASAITVKVFSGAKAAGSPVQTLTTTRLGASWSVAATKPFADGTYTARAQQSDRAGSTGESAPSTFTVQTPSPSPTPSPSSTPTPTPSPSPSPTPTPTPAGTPTPSAFSIGGTISGLSGTVVLQDNGGDDLDVANDGSFTFATELAAGATYSVTVETVPSGEGCTVSGGSGAVFSDVTSVTVTCVEAETQVGADDFDRADGDLGPDWAPTIGGGLSIASDQVVGPAGAAFAGDVRDAPDESYSSDQYSQIELTSNSVGPGVGSDDGEFIGPTVRNQSGGQDSYVGIYFWDNDNPQLQLYVGSPGQLNLLGTYNSGVLPAGTELTLTAVGSAISFSENGVVRIQVNDTTLTGGSPGIIAYDNANAASWSGGDAAAVPSAPPPAMQVQYDGTDGDGVASYDVISSDDGGDAQPLRVLAPTDPAPGVPHNFLYVLPVEPNLGTTYGDGLETLRELDVQNTYNLTIIEPTFPTDPWYADNPTDPTVQYETFMTKDLVPWVTKNLAVTGNEQNWLIGFSKSGIGAQDLILKHPDLFAAAASWDFPADMATYDQFGSSSADEYGTDANFQANYRLTAGFLAAHAAPFTSENRIWIGGYDVFQTDVDDYDALLTSEGLEHSTEAPQLMQHGWDPAWMSDAVTVLSQDGAGLPAAP